jgi:DNA-binding MarR family transcriptional regulator
MPRIPIHSAQHANGLLREVVRLFGQAQRELAACCSEATAKECEALTLLGRAGAISVQEFARRMNLEKTWASRLVDRLVRRKLVRRVAHPTDGRSRLIELTAKGLAERRKLDEALDEQAVNLLGCVPAADRANVERALEALRDALATCLARSNSNHDTSC